MRSTKRARANSTHKRRCDRHAAVRSDENAQWPERVGRVAVFKEASGPTSVKCVRVVEVRSTKGNAANIWTAIQSVEPNDRLRIDGRCDFDSAAAGRARWRAAAKEQAA